MRKVLSMIPGLLMIAIGVIVLIWNLAGEYSTTTGIVFSLVGIALFLAGSAAIKKQK